MDLIEHIPSRPRGEAHQARAVDRIVQAFYTFALTGQWDNSDPDVRELRMHVNSHRGMRPPDQRGYWDHVWVAADRKIAETKPNILDGITDRWINLRQYALLDSDPVNYIVPNVMARFAADELRYLLRIAQVADLEFWFDGGGSITDAMKRAVALAEEKEEELMIAQTENLRMLKSDEAALVTLRRESMGPGLEVDAAARAFLAELQEQNKAFALERDMKIRELCIEHMLLDARAKRLKHWSIFGQGLREWSTCRDFLSRTLPFRQ